MNLASPISSADVNKEIANQAKVRHAVESVEASSLADVCREETNIAIWQRSLSQNLKHSANEFLAANPSLQRNQQISVNSVLSDVNTMLGSSEQPILSEDIAELVDMFCYLFDLKRAGLRLTALDRAMCPRFHVDNVPCRLVTTYQGIATEWLPHDVVNREKLGTGNGGLPDHQSGLYTEQSDIQQLKAGDVALLKGERWQDNENAGLVHRSPAVKSAERRLLLTLDFSI